MHQLTPNFTSAWNRFKADVEAGGDIATTFHREMVALGPEERLNNLYRIRPKRAVLGESSRTQFFTMNRMQRDFWNNRTNRDLVLKMRQGGVTTFACLIALDMCLWTPGVQTAIMADTQPHAKKYFEIVKTAFRCFQRDWGNFYPVKPSYDNVCELKLDELGSDLLVCTDAKGMTLDFLHVAEAAFVEDARISESIEAVPMSAWVVLETTPDTASGMFYDLWDTWEKGRDSTFRGNFYAWWWQYPEEPDLPFLIADETFAYTEEEQVLVKLHDLNKEHIIWRRKKISENKGDVGEFHRKYPEDPLTCFMSGSRCYFPMDVQKSLWSLERPPSFTGDLVSSAG